MSENSSISWLRGGHTASPWIGCKKVGESCRNCYAEAWARRYGRDFNTPTRCKSFEANCRRWNQLAGKFPFRCVACKEIVPSGGVCSDCGTELTPNRPLVFPSLCDWLDDRVPAAWLARMANTIRKCENLIFVLLTKRPENFAQRIAAARDSITEIHNSEDLATSFWLQVWWAAAQSNDGPLHALPPRNVWIGTSAGTQAEVDERIPYLLRIPAAVRFLSLEPLLKGIGFVPADFQGISWCIIGGESGPRFRDCGVQAITATALQIIGNRVPLFIKQDAHRLPGQQGRIPDWLWEYKQMPK